jgi:hypothetical protein
MWEREDFVERSFYEDADQGVLFDESRLDGQFRRGESWQ